MADSEPNNTTPVEVTYVDPNTDDLDQFSALMSGRAQEKPVEEEAAATPEEEPADKNEDQNPDEDENPASEDDNDESEKPAEEEKPRKPTNRYQERINELTAKARDAERGRDELLRRLEALEAGTNKSPSKDETPAPTPSKATPQAPTPNDLNDDGSEKYPLGEFDPSYIRDLTRHTIQEEQAQANERNSKEQAERQAKEAQEALQAEWSERANAVLAKHEDFVEKTMTLESTFEGLDPAYSDYLVNTIKSLDHGPEVLYHFANHLDEAARFVKLGPLAATLALGEMNARFKETPKPTPEPTKVSQAPTPPPTNKGMKSGKTVSGDTDDLDAFAQMFFEPKKRR